MTCIGIETHLVQLAERRDQVRPFARVLEVLQRLVNVGHVRAVLGLRLQFLLLDQHAGRVHFVQSGSSLMPGVDEKRETIFNLCRFEMHVISINVRLCNTFS